MIEAAVFAPASSMDHHLVERLIEEACRWTKVLGSAPPNEASLPLIHAVLIDLSTHWRGIDIGLANLEKRNDLRAELAAPEPSA